MCWNPLKKEISSWLKKHLCKEHLFCLWRDIAVHCVKMYYRFKLQIMALQRCSLILMQQSDMQSRCSCGLVAHNWKGRKKAFDTRDAFLKSSLLFYSHPVCNHKCSLLRAGMCSPTSAAGSSANVVLVTFLCSKHCLYISIAYWAHVFPQPRAWIWDHIV